MYNIIFLFYHFHFLQIFLGNKYGYRPYPNIIEKDEYETLYAEVDRFNTSLLDEWFLLDENMVPAAYILQPITSRFPHYKDESEENAEAHEKVNYFFNIFIDISEIL